MIPYHVEATPDDMVRIRCGEQIAVCTVKEAVRKASWLFAGAELAVEQGRRLSPSRYGLPGNFDISPARAYDLVAEMVDCAATIRLVQRLGLDDDGWPDERVPALDDMTVRLLPEAEADEPRIIRFAH